MTAKLPKGTVRDSHGQYAKVEKGYLIQVTKSSSGKVGKVGKVVEVYDNNSVKAHFGDDGPRTYRAGSYRVL